VYNEYGPPEVLEVLDVEKPTPADDEVLIRVRATTVTVGDTRMRAFRVPLSCWLPARMVFGIVGPKRPVLGMEVAGYVETVGKRVTRYKAGDRVFASTGPELGGYAEYACLPEDGAIAFMPARISYEQAATLCVGGGTALYYLRKAKVEHGQRVLIHGAAGSVGTFAVQLAKLFGAEVTAVCSASNAALVESLGADATIDLTQPDVAVADGAYDVVFDTSGDADYAACMRALKKDGTYLQAAATTATRLRMIWTALTSKRKVVGGRPLPAREDLELLAKLVGAGRIAPVIDRTFSLQQIADAHHYVDAGRKRGNVIVRPPHTSSHHAPTLELSAVMWG
jgi:NADPH:quinone reductase-like Zn-dependent oxidoreductase